MNPSLIKLLPEKYQGKFYNKLFNSSKIHEKYKERFKKVKLEYAPNIYMYDLLLGDVISGNLAFTGLYELKLTKELTRLAKQGGTLLDIGANMGYFTLLWLAANDKNKAFCFEASITVTPKIEANISRNNFNDRATLYKEAAGQSSGVCRFDIGPSDQTGWGGISIDNSASTIEVPLVRVDERINTPIDVMKVDIEGADTWAIMGCEKLLKDKMIKTIFFEHNLPRMKVLGISPDESIQFLKKFGYTIEVFSGHPDQHFCEYKAFI